MYRHVVGHRNTFVAAGTSWLILNGLTYRGMMRRHSRLTRLAAGFRLILAGVSVLLPEQIKVVVRGEGPEKTQNKENNSLIIKY